MTVTNTMGAAELLRKYLDSPAGADLLGEMVKMAAELLMDAEVDVLCGAGYGERSEARVNSRNGHPQRRWDTRAGTIALEIPKLRHGSYLPSLLEPRRRAERALVSVVCQAYIEGVSTKRSPHSGPAPSMPAPTPPCGSTHSFTRCARAVGSPRWRR